jgi:hypothetical protein
MAAMTSEKALSCCRGCSTERRGEKSNSVLYTSQCLQNLVAYPVRPVVSAVGEEMQPSEAQFLTHISYKSHLAQQVIIV